MLPESLTTTNDPVVYQVRDLRFEHVQDACGVGVTQPRLSWITTTPAQNWRQGAYAVACYAADGALLAETGRIESDESVLVAWPFAPLAARERRQVRVRVWGEDGQASPWSEPAPVEAGLLEPGDWAARFITPDWDEDATRPQPAPLFRHEFDLAGDIRQARLYITALGVYTAAINGATVGDHVLAPGWTSYNHRLRYQTFDVTDLLQTGRNALGAVVGEGWHRGRLGYHKGRRNIYGDRAALLAQLEVEYADGTRQTIVTDERWRAAIGPILTSEIYDGESYDARLEKSGWMQPGYDDSAWAGVRLVERSLATLVAPSGPPVRRIEEVAPVAITASPSGRTIVDFGQNLVGRLRITVQGPAGQTITLRHAEVLEHGELSIRPLRYAAATDRYTLAGAGVETWEPSFTFHGFRYAEVTGWPGELTADAIRAVVLHSDLERTGWFECSDPLVNQLHANVVWSMRGNFLDIPTDCPQRDERLGWTGDIQVFAPTASFLYDSAGFLQSWLADLAAEQLVADGIAPFFVPNILDGPAAPAAAWGDAAVIVPWVLYQRYGDAGILATQFASMRAWVDVIAAIAGESRLWEQGMQFGDWLDPKAPPDKPGDARTAPAIVATAYFARCADLVAQTAALLGKTDEAAHYAALSAEVRAAFAHHYVTPAGRLMSDATTAYALALEFALLPRAEQRAYAGKRLAALVRGSGYRISTGFVGTPLVCDALCAAGEYAAAYRLLMQRLCPSWLYPVTMGATTIWERWDSMLPDGAINPGEMTSFNHYALGAVADWLHRTVAGLAPAAPGYRRLEIRPVLGGELTAAAARHRTPYGMAACAWQIEAGQLTLDVEIPANTTATVFLPGQDAAPLEVGSGRHCWRYPYAPPVIVYPPLTLDSTLGDLIDQPAAYARFMQAMVAQNAEMADRMDGQVTITVRQVIMMSPNAPALLEKITAAMGEYLTI
jgi:alpha-L-rhamnosidase